MENDFFEWFDSLEKAIGEAKACKNPDALCPRWYKFLEEVFPEEGGVERVKRN